MLACNAGSKSYKRGQVVQREQEAPEGMVIVQYGVCLLGSYLSKCPNAEMVVISEVATGSVFGGRVLLNQKFDKQSMLSIVAHSSRVDVIIITPQAFAFLEPQSQLTVQNNIKQSL